MSFWEILKALIVKDLIYGGIVISIILMFLTAYFVIIAIEKIKKDKK